MENDFLTPKEKLKELSVFSFPYFERPFAVETDAWARKRRAVLSQRKADGKIHFIEVCKQNLHQRGKRILG